MSILVIVGVAVGFTAVASAQTPSASPDLRGTGKCPTTKSGALGCELLKAALRERERGPCFGGPPRRWLVILRISSAPDGGPPAPDSGCSSGFPLHLALLWIGSTLAPRSTAPRSCASALHRPSPDGSRSCLWYGRPPATPPTLAESRSAYARDRSAYGPLPSGDPSTRPTGENLARIRPQSLVQRLMPALWDEHHVVFALPGRMAQTFLLVHRENSFRVFGGSRIGVSAMDSLKCQPSTATPAEPWDLPG